MPIKINYTVLEKKENEGIDNSLGKIFFFDKYTDPSPFFPYYFLSEKTETIKYENWPLLVQNLYDKKIGFFNNFYEYVSTFQILSFYYTKIDSFLYLKFQNNLENKILFNALNEDREMFFLENNTYYNWNKTITPINNLKVNSDNILFKDNNYFIDSIDTLNFLLKIKITLPNSISFTNSNERFEFGLYRIQGKGRNDSVFLSGLKGKTFGIVDNKDIIGGLKSRSMIAGHKHNHNHLIDHTHTLSHTHSLSGHVHGINHQHNFYDWTINNYRVYSVLNGAGYSGVGVVNPPGFITRSMSEYKGITNYINNNTTSVFNGNTSVPNENITSGVLEKTTNKDNINSDDLNFRVGNKNFAESYVIFPYIYGKIYNK